MLGLAFALIAVALFLDFYLPASVAVVAVAFVLIAGLASVAVHGIRDWRDRGERR